MSALAAYQRDFLARVFAGDGHAEAGLAIYRRNVLGTLVAALAAAYPVVQRLVGEAFFTEAARRYALATPSRQGDLHGFGDGFAAFLEAYPPAQGLPYLGDVARLEWAVHACFHADDVPPLDVARLAAVAAEELERVRLVMHPAVRLVASPHPVAAIHEANRPGRDGTVAGARGAQFLLVHRDGLQVKVEPLEAGEFRFLERLAGGATLGEACDSHAGAREALARCVRAGLLAGFELAA